MNQSIDSTPQNKAQISKLYGITLNGLIGQNLISIYVPYFAIALGASYSQQGLVTSLRTLGNTLTQSFWGNQSDKYGRRPIQIFGYVILAGTALLFTRSMNINLFLLLLALQGFCGFAVLPVVTNAMLGDVALERERGAFIGNVSSFGTFGLVPVVLLFGYLLDRQELTGPDQYHFVFLSGIGFIAITIALLLSLKETLTTKPTHAFPPLWTIIQRDRRVRRFLMIDASYTAIMGLVWPLFPFVMKEVVHATNAQISATFAGWMLATAVAQKYGGKLSDRIGRKPLLIISRFLLATLPLSTLLTYYWPSWWLIMAAQGIAGFGGGWSVLLEQMIALDLAPVDQKALYTGIIFTVTGVAGFFGAFLSGTLTQFLTLYFGQFRALFLMLGVATAGRFILGITHFLLDETAPSLQRN